MVELKLRTRVRCQLITGRRVRRVPLIQDRISNWDRSLFLCPLQSAALVEEGLVPTLKCRRQ